MAVVVGGLGGAVALAGGWRDLPGWLVVLYPLVTLSASVGGARAGLASSVAAYLVMASSLASSLELQFLVGGSLIAVGASAGIAADRLVAARNAEREGQLAATSYAATLHHRLMLAEQEIERLSGAAGRDAVPEEEEDEFL